MKTTTHYKGHRWTTDELRQLMKLWAEEETLPTIAAKLSATTAAVQKMVNKMRKNGIPLVRRKRGHVAGRSNKLWTQGEVEYLIRRRNDKATSEEIAVELGRSWNAVSAMIQNLRQQDVPVGMLGSGVRKLWNVDALKAVAIQAPESNIIELDNIRRVA